MTERILQEVEADLLKHLYDKLLENNFPPKCPLLSVSCLTFDNKTFFDIIQPLPDLADIMIVHMPFEQPYSMILLTAIKYTLRRLAMPIEKSYSFDKIRLWEKNLLTPHEIVRYLQKELSQILADFKLSFSLFYGRINFRYHSFTYLNCGLGVPIHINEKQQKSSLHQKWMTLGAHTPIFKESHAAFHPGDWLLYYYSEDHEKHRNFAFENLEKFLFDQAKDHFDKDADNFLFHFKNLYTNSDNGFNLKSNFFLFALKINNRDPDLFSPKEKKAVFSSDLNQLHIVRSFVRDVCQHAPGDYNRLETELQIVVNELFCNIVKHAYQNDSRGEIHIESQSTAEGIYFTLSDRGKGFNPTTIYPPDLSGQQEHGFGFFIVQQIVDHLSYLPKDEETAWNHIRIFKRYFFKEDQMEFSHYTQGNKLIITPKEENLDAKNAAHFKDQVLEEIRKAGLSEVIFNLSHLQFIDSSGLGALLSLQRALHTQRGNLKLTHLNKPIRTMFEIVSMHRIFEIYNSIEEALHSYE